MKTLEEKAIDYAEANVSYGMSKESAIRAYIAGATEALANQWRSVEDELPEESNKVFDTGISLYLTDSFIVYVDYGKDLFYFFIVSRKKYRDTEWLWWECDQEREIRNVTHWMPIKPPKPESHA